MEDGGFGAAPRFHGAAAASLHDAKHPGEVVEILEVVRLVVLGDAGADGSHHTNQSDANFPSSSSVTAPETATDRTLFPDTTRDLKQLANECIKVTNGRNTASQSSVKVSASPWDGFEVVGDVMLHVVSHAWLPCFTAAQRTGLFDENLSAMPAGIAVRVLVPALAPSRTLSGRNLSEYEQHVVASTSAAALLFSIKNNLAKKLLLDTAHSNTKSQTEDDVRLLLSSADRVELNPGGEYSQLAKQLHPHLFACEMAKQFINAACEVETKNEIVIELAAFALSVLARRGNAPAVAEALIDTVTDMDGLNTSTNDSLNVLIAAMPDAHAVEKTTSAILKTSDARRMEWRPAERVLRSTLSKRFWECDTTRHTLMDTVLVRKVVPRRVLPALIRFVVVSPPENEKESFEKTIKLHRSRALSCVADAWSDPDTIRAGPLKLRGHVASLTAAVLFAVPVEVWRGEGGVDSHDFGPTGAALLMRGVTARLDSPDADTRRHGRKVASALALAIDPEKPLTFNDDEDFGVGNVGNEMDDVSEDEQEWERDAGRLKMDAVDEREFVDSMIRDGDETNTNTVTDKGSTSEHSGSESQYHPDLDDPDAAVAMGGGVGQLVSEASDTDSDSDDSDASSVLEPYDMYSESEADVSEDEGDEGDTTADGDVIQSLETKRRRVKRRKEIARRRVTNLPKPDSLRKTIEALSQKRDASESSSTGKSATDRADAAEGAVYAVEGLIRAVPEELVNCTAQLVSALVHAHPPTPDVVGLEKARRKSLIALAATAPGIAGPALCAEAFLTGRCDAGQQLEVLDIVADAARELSSLPAVKRNLLRDEQGSDSEEDVPDEESKSKPKLKKLGIERRFAPKALARLRHNNVEKNAPTRTRAHLVVDAFAGPLIARLGKLVQSAEKDARKQQIAEMQLKKDPDAVHVPGGGIDAIVLGRALGALGELCACSRNAPNAAQLSGAVLELLSNQAIHNHRHPHVRRAALFAAYGAVSSVSPAIAWNALVGIDSAINAQGASRLGNLLNWTEGWASQTHGNDSDHVTRQLALRVELAGADLRQKASQVSSKNENRNDPLYVLKNLTQLAVDL